MQCFFNKCFFLYLGVAVLFFGIVDHRRVVLRTLDYFPAVPPFMVQYAQTQKRGSFYVRGPEALRYYKNLVKLFPDSATVLSNLAFCYFQVEDYKRAARYYEKAVLLDPQLFGLHYNLGVTYLHLEKFDRALESFRKAVHVDPVKTLMYPSVIDPFRGEGGDGDFKMSRGEAVKAGYLRCYQMIKLLLGKNAGDALALDEFSAKLYYYLPVYQRSSLSARF